MIHHLFVFIINIFLVYFLKKVFFEKGLKKIKKRLAF